MCLSRVYRNEMKKDAVLLEDVCTIRSENGTVILTDIMGVQLCVPGYVKFADLTGGTVIIEAEE